MTRIFEKQDFWDLRDDGSALQIRDMEFRRCRFIGCVLSNTTRLDLRARISRVTLRNCAVSGGSLDTAIVEDSWIENLTSDDLVRIYGMAFRHVVLRGNMGRLMLAPFVVFSRVHTDEGARAINKANAEFYRDVDWALDISEAQFSDCDIRNVPARLIRRDARTQAVVRREKALDGRWRNLDLSQTHWAMTIEDMLSDGADDCLLVATKRSREFKKLLRGIELLRDAGIAEPD